LTEDLFHLPNFYVYPLPEDTPPVCAAPAEENGFVTFASFNKPCKMNNTVLDLWSEILNAVPEARLMLKFKNYMGIPAIKRKFLDRFEANGISPDRINLVSSENNFYDHLNYYNQADIALDTFPFAGATTTFQALWMGVPVISLMTERFIGRAGGAMSLQAGIDSVVAETPDAYVEHAVTLAGDLPRLKSLKSTLRQRVENSPLCDGPAYARNVEKAFHTMWES
jgi:predicted O-linked N-acetylglucosamine transferase (SPINDLY family)